MIIVILIAFVLKTPIIFVCEVKIVRPWPITNLGGSLALTLLTNRMECFSFQSECCVGLKLIKEDWPMVVNYNKNFGINF